MLKLKHEPKDFLVEEISDITLSKTGNFSIYKLTKENLETIELIKHIAFENNISLSEIGYAGIKDKRAITTQYISTPKNKPLQKLKGKGFSLTYVGNSNSNIETGNLESNKFTITIRNINDFELNNFEKYKEYVTMGVPNYFDSQRFGSHLESEFIGKLVLEKKCEEAVYLFLYLSYLKLYTNPNNKNSNKKSNKGSKKPYSKEKFYTLISNFEKNLPYPYYNSLKSVFKLTQNFKQVFLKIPKKQQELFVMAYQSYLFNECVKEVLVKHIGTKNIEKVPYEAGVLFFQTNFTRRVEGIKSFPLIGRKDEFNEFEEEIISTILQREHLEFSAIKSLSKTGVFLKTQHRNLFTIPKNFKVEEVEEEDFQGKERTKIVLSFELEKGAYATNIIKFLFRK